MQSLSTFDIHVSGCWP